MIEGVDTNNSKRPIKSIKGNIISQKTTKEDYAMNLNKKIISFEEKISSLGLLKKYW